MRAVLSVLLLPLAFVDVGSAEQQWVQQEPGVPAHNHATSSWVKGDKPPQDYPMKFTVVVRVDEDRLKELERVFWEVSDPEHANYGKHLSVDGVTALLAVPAERTQRVQRYFEGAGATEVVVSPNGDMLTVTMPVSAAEAALRTTLHQFTHSEHHNAPPLVRASGHYFLPTEIDRDVVMVGELLQFPRLRPKSMNNLRYGAGTWPNSCDSSDCKGLVTPGVLQQRYKLPAARNQSYAADGGANSMAVAEFQGQYFKPKDISTFGTSCHRDVSVEKVIGFSLPIAGIEAELDIEYIKSVAPGVPLTVINSFHYSLLNWANQITSLSDAPYVHSVSYGNDEKQQTSKEYMYTCNTAFMKAGARGLSILFASGDQGVCGREGCVFGGHFHPDFPASSPYITAVGGTNFAGTDVGEETAWGAGGGGFSDTFPAPAYQEKAVAAYLADPAARLPPQKLWNASGRGFPDVAALGGLKAPYCISTSGGFEGVAGTSASSPVVAGVFALLNGLRLASGKPVLGFLNPFIYQNPSGFQDVTSGCNSDTGRYGFTAIKGWDAATGFGTPDYQALAKLAMAAAPATSGPNSRTSVIV